MTVRQIRRLLHQLLDAIAYCHRRGVLHRNLKPKHLLIKTSNESLGTAFAVVIPAIIGKN